MLGKNAALLKLLGKEGFFEGDWGGWVVEEGGCGALVDSRGVRYFLLSTSTRSLFLYSLFSLCTNMVLKFFVNFVNFSNSFINLSLIFF